MTFALSLRQELAESATLYALPVMEVSHGHWREILERSSRSFSNSRPTILSRTGGTSGFSRTRGGGSASRMTLKYLGYGDRYGTHIQLVSTGETQSVALPPGGKAADWVFCELRLREDRLLSVLRGRP